MAESESEATITERVDWAEGLRSLRIDRTLPFAPGQFANLSLDIEGERVRRSYSIASAVADPLEFYLTNVQGGRLTQKLFALDVGDRVGLDHAAAGLLTLDLVPDFAKDLWLLSTGTGLAPFLSMLRSGVLFPRFENVIVVNSARYNAHLGYRHELELFAEQSEGRMRYLTLVSREPAMNGAMNGRITTALEDGRLEGKSGVHFDPERSHFMLCGNPDMVSEARAMLLDRGFKKNKRREPGHISIEKYW